MSADFKRVAVAVAYVIVLLALLRPGSDGQSFVSAVGSAMSNLVTMA